MIKKIIAFIQAPINVNYDFMEYEVFLTENTPKD